MLRLAGNVWLSANGRYQLDYISVDSGPQNLLITCQLDIDQSYIFNGAYVPHRLICQVKVRSLGQYEWHGWHPHFARRWSLRAYSDRDKSQVGA